MFDTLRNEVDQIPDTSVFCLATWENTADIPHYHRNNHAFAMDYKKYRPRSMAKERKLKYPMLVYVDRVSCFTDKR